MGQNAASFEALQEAKKWQILLAKDEPFHCVLLEEHKCGQRGCMLFRELLWGINKA